MLFLWIKKNFRIILRDLPIAVDQVLYNLQVAKTSSSDLKAQVSLHEGKLS
jgi:hypothetical protein